MGNASSANDEWIELYNDGSSVDVTGWVLSDGANLSIDLAGAVGAGQYAVLERTDDSSAPGTAFLIYTGALSNTGATLTLRDASGAIKDQVAGGADWSNIGGDNATKETAQYTTAGWQTGSPTPGSVNVTGNNNQIQPDDEADTDDDSSEEEIENKTSTSKPASGTKANLLIKDQKLSVSLTAPTIAYVHQPVEFQVKATGLNKGLLDTLYYHWNFGDLVTFLGEDATHRYDYPGKYVVMLEVSFAERNATVRHEITVLPVTFSLTKNQDGDIQVHNNAKYEVDVSGYKLGGIEFVEFPAGSILLPNSTLTVPKERVSTENGVWLSDQMGELVAAIDVPGVRGESVAVVAATPPPPQTATSAPATPPVALDNASFSFPTNPAPPIESAVDSSTLSAISETEVSTTQIENAATVNQAPVPIDNDKLPYLGLIGILGVGILAMYVSKVKR